MNDVYMQAEHELATAKGWTDLVDAGGTWVGRPPSGGVRGQAAVPPWTRSWAACGPLLGEYRVELQWTRERVIASEMTIRIADAPLYHVEKQNQHDDEDAAARYAITKVATQIARIK